MSAATHTRGAPAFALDRIMLASWVVPAALFGAALAARLGAMLAVRFPMTEGSAYYVAVARNIAAGRGFVVDSIWSYATPPLVLPRPAFELWQPLASVIAALPMTLLGPGFASAQLAFAILGAALAPLAWYVARDLATRLELEPGRAAAVGIGAGALAAVCGPLVFSSAVPDSTLPFTVAVAAACVLMPGAISGSRRHIVALGLAAGLAYLARTEALYLVAAFAVVGLSVGVGWRPLILRGGAVAAVGALVAAPWWLRNVAVFGRPLPTQLTDNAFLTRNEQIFGWLERPSLDGFLAQGLPVIVGNIVGAFRHDIVDVVMVPAAGIAFAGVAWLVLAGRSRTALRGSPVLALLVTGLTTLAITSTLFPVATLWGTFEHAAGPLILALVVLAAAAADAFVARVRAWRGWPRSNAWLAQAALVALTVPLTVVQLGGASAQARAEETRFADLAMDVPVALSRAGIDPSAPVISDRALWLADAQAAPTLTLPDEPVTAVLDLARTFGAQAVVVVEGRGAYPAALEASPCFVGLPGVRGASAFSIVEACR